MSAWLRVAAPAKLNLLLQITSRRPDGYHLLQTVIDPIDWMDEVRLRRRRDARIVRRHGPGWVAPQQDLAVRAAQLLQSHAGIGLGADLCIRKRVPSGAGRGGGSADAAAVLLGLNRLWRLELPLVELEQLGLQLGTDVPAMLRARPLWADHLGECMTEIALPARHYVVLFPACAAPTAQMYKSPQLVRDSTVLELDQWIAAPIYDNAFEPVLTQSQPAVGAALAWLRACLPHSQLTGSGSAIFAPANSREQARAVASACPNPWLARACRSWRGRRWSGSP